jgi:hypothetical protein
VPRTRPLLALSAPLALLACLVGHAVGYGIAHPDPREEGLHGYLAYGPLFVTLCLSIAALAVLLRASGRFQGAPSAWPFALIGPLAFSLQELIERLAVDASPTALLQPAVLFGLLAQLPLALVAYGLAQALLRGADAVATAFASPRRVVASPGLLPVPAAEPALPRPAFAHVGCGRSPPG